MTTANRQHPHIFDVAPDGRFLPIDAPEETVQAVYIPTNWFEELRERVGN